MKRFHSILIFTVLSFFFLGCVQSVTSFDVFNTQTSLLPDSNQGLVKVSLSGTNSLATSLNQNGISCKTAMPSIDYSAITYTVYTTDSNGNRVDASLVSGLYQIALSAGSYTISAEGRYNGNLISEGSNTVSVDAGGQYSVSVITRLITTGTGDVNLKVANFTWYAASGREGIVKYAFDNGAETVVEAAGPGDLFSYIHKTGVSTGAHEVTISYYAVHTESGNSYEYLLYRTSEVINVFPNLTTNCWNTDSPYVTGTGTDSVFTITEQMLIILQSTTLYVNANGTHFPQGDSNSGAVNNGTYLKPFTTIYSAIEKIKHVFPCSTGQFIIYVDGTLNAGTEIDGIKVKIASYSTTERAKFEGSNGVAGYKFEVMPDSELTFENIIIEYFGCDEDGAVIVRKKTAATQTNHGKLTLRGNCSIKDNNWTNVGGVTRDNNIYLERGTIIKVEGLLTGSKIGVRNEAQPTAAAPVYVTSGFTNAYYGQATGASSDDVASKIFSSDEGYVIGTISPVTGVYEAAMGFSSGSVSAKVKDDVSVYFSPDMNDASKTWSKYYSMSENTVLYPCFAITSGGVTTKVTYNDIKYDSHANPTGLLTNMDIKLICRGVDVSDMFVHDKVTNGNACPIIFIPTGRFQISQYLPEDYYGLLVEFSYDGVKYSDFISLAPLDIVYMNEPVQGVFEVNSDAGVDKISEWVTAGKSLRGSEFKFSGEAAKKAVENLNTWTEQAGGLSQVTITLEDDVTLTGTWTPLGTGTNTFKGIIKGKSATNPTTISGLNITATNGGFIGKSSGCTIENIILEGTSTSAGFIGEVTYGNDTIKNCVNKVTCSGSSNAAGFVAYISKNKDGSNDNNVEIDSCINYGDITATGSSSYAGGIVGFIKNDVNTRQNAVYITNCTNYGTIKNDSGYAAGISAYRGNIKNCCNMGAITVTGYGYGGGIMGYTRQDNTNDNSEYKLYCINNVNYGSLTGTYVGGIAGYLTLVANANYFDYNYTSDGTGEIIGVGYDSGSSYITKNPPLFVALNGSGNYTLLNSIQVAGNAASNELFTLLNNYATANTGCKSWKKQADGKVVIDYNS